MTDKQIYKVVDEKGRVLIPARLRSKSGIDKGNIVKLSMSFGKIGIEKVNIIELGNMSEEAISDYIAEAAKTLPNDKIIDMAAFLMQIAKSGTDKFDGRKSEN